MLAARSLSRLNVVRAGARSTSIALNITSTRCKSNFAIISPLIRHSTLLRQISPSKPVSFSRLSAVRWQSSGGSGPQNPDKPSSPSASSPKEQKTPANDASVGETSAQQGISIDGDTPLPDLRQGIPSTFAAEYLKQEPGKEESAEKRHELDITDQDAETEGTKSSRRGGRGETPRSAYETSIDKRRAAVARYFYMLWAASMIGGAVYYGRNWDTEEEERAHPDAPSGWGAMLMYNRVKTRVSEYLGYYTEPTFPKLLPIVKDQNIPPYTLVISLEDMLVHSEWSRDHGWRTAKRPGVDFFLLYLSQYYELCLFTTVQSAMGDPIVRKLDPFHVIMWPLFREATRYDNGDYVKDLSYLNRSLAKTILVDSDASHAKAQPENAIILKPWKGDPSDRELLALIPFLEYVAVMGMDDVRTAIQSFEGKHIPTEFADREARMRAEFAKQMQAAGATKKKSTIGKWAGSIGGQRHGEGHPNVSDALAEGKTLFDVMREEGMRRYKIMEEEIKKNGEAWLKEEAEMIKKMEAEAMGEMKKGMFSWVPGVGGATKPPGDSSSKPATS